MSSVIEQFVQSKYGAVARSGLSTAHSRVRAVAEAFGYTPEMLALARQNAVKGNNGLFVLADRRQPPRPFAQPVTAI
jgi:hypothetical protein